MRKMLLLVAAILVSSCCGIPQQAELPLPSLPIWPELNDSELACVSNKTYEKIVLLDVACKESIKTHQNIIKSTHRKGSN